MDGPAGAADGGRADLREFDGDAGLRAKEGAGSGAGAVAARAGHRGDAGGERRSRSRHGLTGPAEAAWPAVALVGSYELLMLIIRAAQLPETGTAPGRAPECMPGTDPLQAQAEHAFAGELAAGRVPSVRAIRARLHMGQPRAQRVRAYLAALNGAQAGASLEHRAAISEIHSAA